MVAWKKTFFLANHDLFYLVRIMVTNVILNQKEKTHLQLLRNFESTQQKYME